MQDERYHQLIGRLWQNPQYTIFIDLCIKGYQGIVTKMIRVVADAAYDEGYRDGLQVQNKPGVRHDG